MKLPKKIKVGGHVYRIVFPYRFKERTDILGQADHDLNEIRLTDKDGLDNKRVVSSVEESLIHEVLHCVDWVYNSGKLEEDVIKRLSQGLYQVFKENKIL